jgi:SAM-dependent methyltransferase
VTTDGTDTDSQGRVDKTRFRSYRPGMAVEDRLQGKPSRTGHAPGRLCPWWAGPLLCCPLRRWLEPPERLLGPYVRPGMTVLEPGCGMGYFSLTLARLVGPAGRVVCVDVQPRMLSGLVRRAKRAGLLERITTAVCSPEDLGVVEWEGRVDLAVAIHVVHEVGDPEDLFRQIARALRPGGQLFVLEPTGHVSKELFDAEMAAASRAALTVQGGPSVRRNLAALLTKPGTGAPST